MKTRQLARAAAIILLCQPASAAACTWCISSAFGDRSFNWPYLALIVVPFGVAGVIGGVLAYHAGWRPRALAARLALRLAALRLHRTKETT